jgi:hypothetical protein
VCRNLINGKVLDYPRAIRVRSRFRLSVLDPFSHLTPYPIVNFGPFSNVPLSPMPLCYTQEAQKLKTILAAMPGGLEGP